MCSYNNYLAIYIAIYIVDILNPECMYTLSVCMLYSYKRRCMQTLLHFLKLHYPLYACVYRCTYSYASQYRNLGIYSHTI